jgi:hypothetical protein
MTTQIAQVPVKELQAQKDSVESFISQAIASNVPIETLERLMKLRKEVKAEMAEEAFAQAKAKLQQECPVIEKKKKVLDKYKVERYKYAPMDDIVDQTKEVIGRNGFSYSFDTIDEPTAITAIVTVRHSMGHAEKSSFKIPFDQESYMTAPQKYASALTFAKRYAFCNAFGISTGDPDMDAADVGKDTEKEEEKNNAAVDKFRDLMHNAKSFEELGSIWTTIPAKYHLTLVPFRDQCKAKFTKKV